MIIKRVTDYEATLNIGFQGENLARSFEWDLSEWHKAFGDGSAAMLVQRAEDSAAYPVVVEFTNDVLRWSPTSADTAQAGVGELQIQYVVDNVVVKQRIMSMNVKPSLDEGAEPPDPWQGWVDQVLEAASEAEDAAEDAKASKEAADESASNAEADALEAGNAKDAAVIAQGKAEDAQAAAETAQGKAEDAQSAAETAAASIIGLLPLDTPDIKDGAITEEKLADGAVTNGKIAIEGVDSDNIADEAITESKITDGAVSLRKIAAGAVGRGVLAKEYSKWVAYNKGDYMVHILDATGEAYIERALVDVPDGENYTPSHWETIGTASAGSVCDDIVRRYIKPLGGIPGDDIADDTITGTKIKNGVVPLEKLTYAEQSFILGAYPRATKESRTVLSIDDAASGEYAFVYWFLNRPYDPNLSYNNIEIMCYGKNILWPGEELYERGKYLDANGEEKTASAYAYYKYYLPVLSDTDYVFSGSVVTASLRNIVHFYDEKKMFLGIYDPGAAGVAAQFKTPANCCFIRFNLANSAVGGERPIQLEIGSVATTYSPCGRSVHTISLPTFEHYRDVYPLSGYGYTYTGTRFNFNPIVIFGRSEPQYFFVTNGTSPYAGSNDVTLIKTVTYRRDPTVVCNRLIAAIEELRSGGGAV